ncbi:MAG TPA: TOPRIM nucleotidyl transferase/hydrolase domain-containing protein, partial [Gaiellales bacterium]|nr:TOPRIM nucleotidyl transferase/hydrolase domain-containing protein [Gaiellales bacterium]
MRGYRTALDVEFAPGAMCALVGEAGTGKSTLLAAVRSLLEPSPLTGRPHAVAGRPAGPARVDGRLARGESIWVDCDGRRGGAATAVVPELVHMPADRRAGDVVSPTARPGPAHGHITRALASGSRPAAGASTTASAVALVRAVESAGAAAVRGAVLLIEEPELYLRPQAQRYLYRLLRTLAAAGNQVIYSTHAPAFLNVGRLEELVLVGYDPATGMRLRQPQPFAEEGDFRTLVEFDSERSELFLARSALLVEGMTEKLAFPFVFAALGHDPDREAISIIACGGKSNIPLFARVCSAVGVPFVVVHDRDAPAGRRPIAAERVVNRRIAEVAGGGRTVVLTPDFEGVAGLSGRSHKPERAW